MVNINEVRAALEQEKVDNSKVITIISKLKAKEEAKKIDKSTDEQKIKKQFVLIANGDFGWALQLNEGEDPATVVDKVKRVGATFNLSRKGKKIPVKTIGEVFENVPRRFFVTENLYAKHKLQVFIAKTDNKL